MTKKELIKKIADDTGISQKQSGEVFDCVIQNIMETVATGDKVQIAGFGTFESRRRGARTGVNPQTKEKVYIPASVIPAFKPSKVFKDKVDK